MKIIGALFGLIVAALVAAAYFIFRPAETRRRDKKNLVERVQNAYRAVADYFSKLFSTDKAVDHSSGPMGADSQRSASAVG
jgi:hypothetical protein